MLNSKGWEKFKFKFKAVMGLTMYFCSISNSTRLSFDI